MNDQIPDISAPDWGASISTQVLCDGLHHVWVLGESPSVITLVADADSVGWTPVSEGEDMSAQLISSIAWHITPVHCVACNVVASDSVVAWVVVADSESDFLRQVSYTSFKVPNIILFVRITNK